MSEEKKISILSVDDETTNRMVIDRALNRQYEVVPAQNGQEALTKLRQQHFDLILLDMMMPVMDGRECCRQIKEDESLKNIPIIFLTAKHDVKDIKEGLSLGANDYVVKPFNPTELRARVKTQLKISAAQNLQIQFHQLSTVHNLMASLNHEMRNSLAIVMGRLQTMKFDDDKNKEKVASALKAAEHMTAVLEKISNLEEVKTVNYTEDSGMLDIAEIATGVEHKKAI